jgi:hypothetical protein
MIELVPSESDDVAFLERAQRIVNGAIAALGPREVYLVHIDNWFDHKWLGFWSGKGTELCVPPFNPNRVHSENRFTWNASTSQWTSTGLEMPLHCRQPGRRSTFAQPLDRLSKSAAFIWYSGNTVTNGAGSLMLYLSGAECYAWYASFKKREHWKIDGERQITKRELESFEKSGRQMEPVGT